HIGSILYSQSAYSFTKSTGILKHSYFVRYVGGNENEFDYYLSLSRLDGQIGVEMVLVIGSAAIVGVMITIVVLKKRK
ncbi:MAG: hypothetical protein ACXABX_01390, partial [Candidatus Thorarchaeota archaeon]